MVETGVYVHSESRLAERLDLVTALRVDTHNRLGGMNVSPRAALVHRPSDGQNLRLTYNRAFVTPGPDDLALNAPSHKGSLAVAFTDRARGLHLDGRRRFSEGFDMRSGVFVGPVDAYRVLDLTAGYQLPFQPSTRLEVTVYDALNNLHREFVGAPEPGRLALMRVKYDFRDWSPMSKVGWFSQTTLAKLRSFLPALVLALAAPTPATPQETRAAAGTRIHRSIPPPGARTHLVVPGERFRAGPFKRLLHGDNYRNLWNTPIEVAVLDLDGVGGGLTPLRTGGGGQSISLHFTGADGIRYVVRSLDKDTTRRLAAALRNTVVGEVLHDLVSAMLPTGALVVDPLLEAAGILHSRYSLVVIPDDPRLGEYREEFAGLIGTLQLHPSEGPDDTPGFADSRKVSGTENMLDDLEDSACERVDARAFLKARLLDFVIGDGDRHPGQWRWARFADGDCYNWLPVPEDRDQAFIHYGGLAMMLVRKPFPRAVRFGDTYPSVAGLTTNGWGLDRRLLAELDRPDWDEAAGSLRTILVDSVIDYAVRRLPAPYHELVGEGLEAALKARRDALPEFAARYYELITREVEIQATDEDEYARLEHLANGDLVVRIGVVGEAGEGEGPPWFERTFRHAETREVRLYLRGGADRADVVGAAGRIIVRVDGGGGSDTFTNASEAGASKTRFYDHRGENVFVKGTGASIDERPYRRPPATTQPRRPYSDWYALDWGHQAFTFPTIWVDPDLGAFVQAVHRRTHFGYRKGPFASRHSLSVGMASRGYKPFASYEGIFRRVWPNVDARLAVEYSGLDVTRFTGFGNDFRLENPSSFYKVRQATFALAPALEFETGAQDREAAENGTEPHRSELTVSLGPVIKWSNTSEDANEDYFIGSLEQPPYGTGSFGQVGARGEIEYDRRDNPAFPTHGFFARAAAAGYAGAWDVESAFGSVDGEARTYLTARIPATPTLALGVGGKKVWGKYPFLESAFLGGPGQVGLRRGESPVRGLHKNRFAGDASLYANVELRLAVAEVRILVPGEFGVFGAADVGRVFHPGDPDDAGDWHNGTGGGLWLSFLERATTLSLAVMKGRDLTGVYVRAGHMF